MSDVIDVETDDFLASGSLASQAAKAARQARSRARSALSASGEMAGSDPAGHQWATSYDKAARQAFTGLDGLILAFEEVAAGLTVTGNNYATAEWLSAGHSGTAPGAAHPATPTGESTSPPPSASGGNRSFGAPGFDLVAKFIGDLWPDGDTGKLRHAGSAWNALGADLDAVAGQWSSILMVLGDSNTPEMPSICQTVQLVKSHTTEMATQARAIGAAATSFATHIDEVHTETERELESLLLQVELTAAGGLILTVVTAGMSDAAAAAGATAEVAGAVTRILAFIARLASAVTKIAEDVSEAAGAFVKASTVSEKIGIKIAGFAGKAVRYGLSGSATNVTVTAITDPGEKLGDAAVSGFVAGAGFGALGEGAAIGGKAVKAGLANRSAMFEVVDGHSMLGPANIDHSAPGGDLIPLDYKPTGDLTADQFLAKHWDPESVNTYDKTVGGWNYPGDGGFDLSKGAPVPFVGKTGMRYDRYGPTFGRYLAPYKTPFPGRAVAPSSLGADYHVYEQLKPFDEGSGIGKFGPAAPAFEQVGGGPQIETTKQVEWLLTNHYLKDITEELKP